MEDKYKNAYDDPYAVLAHNIIAHNNTAEIQRILEDNGYIQRLILKETRLQDFCGFFLDCIIQDILDNKRRMDFMHKLDELSEYFYANLDVDRLRSEIIKYGVRYKIIKL